MGVVVVSLAVLTMIAIMMVAVTKPAVGVRVGLGCLAVGILAYLVAARMAQNSDLAFGDPGTGGIMAALFLSLVLFITGVVVLFGALVGLLVKQDRRRSSPARPSSTPSTTAKVEQDGSSNGQGVKLTDREFTEFESIRLTD